MRAKIMIPQANTRIGEQENRRTGERSVDSSHLHAKKNKKNQKIENQEK